MHLSRDQFKALKKRFLSKQQTLDNNWRSQWLEISNYISPAHGQFLNARDAQGSQGQKKNQYIINSTATRAANVAAAGIKGGLTPHSLPWFKCSLEDKDLAKWEPARVWLSKVEEIMYNTFSKSNFYHAVHNVYFEELLFGSSPMLIAEDKQTICHYKPWTVGEYVIATDDRGRIISAYRWHWESAGTLALRFGKENLSERTKKLVEDNPYEMVQIIHCVFKREAIDFSSPFAIDMPWGSVFWEHKTTDCKPLGESGYNTCPVPFPRWDLVGADDYGTSCPGMQTVGDVKMLQKMERDILLGIHKEIDPPVNVPAKMAGRLSTLPGAHNLVSTKDREVIEATYQVRLNVSNAQAKIDLIEQRISDSFYNDLFLMILQTKNMTATEVAQRHEDKLAILGPVIERQLSELLAPTISRQFDILQRQELIPPPPEELADKELEPEFVSILAQAQKMVGTQAIEKHMGFVGNMAQLFPEILDTVDPDEASRQYGEMVGTPPKITRSPEAIKKKRAERQQMQEAAMAQEQMAAMASTGKDLAQIPTDEENAASSILGQMTEQ